MPPVGNWNFAAHVLFIYFTFLIRVNKYFQLNITKEKKKVWFPNGTLLTWPKICIIVALMVIDESTSTLKFGSLFRWQNLPPLKSATLKPSLLSLSVNPLLSSSEFMNQYGRHPRRTTGPRNCHCFHTVSAITTVEIYCQSLKEHTRTGTEYSNDCEQKISFE